MDQRKKLADYKNINLKWILMNIQQDTYLTMILIHLNYKTFYSHIKTFYGFAKTKKILAIKFAFKIQMQ